MVALVVASGCAVGGSGATPMVREPTDSEPVGVSIDVPVPVAGEQRPAAIAPPSEDAGPSGRSNDRSYSIVAHATSPMVVIRFDPAGDAEVRVELPNPTASGSPLVFRAVDGDQPSSLWLQVQLPIQPNGSTGWVRRSDVALSNNPYRMIIDRASYSLQVYHLDQLWIDTSIAVGNGATPTPVGEFYLKELLQPSRPDGPYGPFAFGLSGFSEVLDSFGGADAAIIGIHGTNDPASLGTDVSHGCVRLNNDVIEQLAETLPLGTPVEIT